MLEVGGRGVPRPYSASPGDIQEFGSVHPPPSPSVTAPPYTPGAFVSPGELFLHAVLPNGTVRKKLVGSYMRYYFPDRADERIYILRVLYGRRNLDELLREMDLN